MSDHQDKKCKPVKMYHYTGGLANLLDAIMRVEKANLDLITREEEDASQMVQMPGRRGNRDRGVSEE